MDEELSYAEMLEIPVETVTVKRKDKKRRRGDADLEQQVLEKVNSRMEDEDPTFAESTEIAREERPKKRRAPAARMVLIGEFVAVCALCAVIFLTNLFVTNSAINTFVRGLFQGQQQAAEATDNRTYSDFKLKSVVNAYEDVEIAVSETGVLSFTERCSIYSPCEGKVASVNGNEETGYTMEIKHSDSFSTIMSGLNTVFVAAGDTVYSNLPVAYSNGENAVRVMFYSDGALLTCVSVGEGGIAWS